MTKTTIEYETREEKKEAAALIMRAYKILEREEYNTRAALKACFEEQDEYERRRLALAVGLVKFNDDEANEILQACTDGKAEPLPDATDPSQPALGGLLEDIEALKVPLETLEQMVAVLRTAAELTDGVDYAEALLQSASIDVEVDDDGLPIFGDSEDALAAAIDLFAYDPNRAGDLLFVCERTIENYDEDEDDSDS